MLLRVKLNAIFIPPLAEWWVYWNTLFRPTVRPHIIPISRMVNFCKSYSPFHVCLTIRPSAHLVYATSHLSFCLILFIFGILVGHDLSMRILYRFHGWLIFARVKALFMFVWPYVHSHILCTQLVFCRILFIFGILIGHDLSMRILYRFYGWVIFARVMALFMFPYDLLLYL